LCDPKACKEDKEDSDMLLMEPEGGFERETLVAQLRGGFDLGSRGIRWNLKQVIGMRENNCSR